MDERRRAGGDTVVQEARRAAVCLVDHRPTRRPEGDDGNGEDAEVLSFDVLDQVVEQPGPLSSGPAWRTSCAWSTRALCSSIS